MDLIKFQRRMVKTFWNDMGNKLKHIQSIDSLYGHFVTYCSERSKYPPINRYIFRNLVRKLGYNNENRVEPHKNTDRDNSDDPGDIIEHNEQNVVKKNEEEVRQPSISELPKSVTPIHLNENQSLDQQTQQQERNRSYAEIDYLRKLKQFQHNVGTNTTSLMKHSSPEEYKLVY